MTDHNHSHHVHEDGSVCHCDSDESASNADIAIDPVCLMEVNKTGAQHVASFGGHQYYFCSPGCRAKFVANPQAYVTSA